MLNQRVTSNSPISDGLVRIDIQHLLKEVTLALGGVFYAYPVPDEAVWETARSLDRIFRNAMKSFSEDSDEETEATRHSQGRKHPAIAEILRRLDKFAEYNSVGKN